MRELGTTMLQQNNNKNPKVRKSHAIPVTGLVNQAGKLKARCLIRIF